MEVEASSTPADQSAEQQIAEAKAVEDSAVVEKTDSKVAETSQSEGEAIAEDFNIAKAAEAIGEAASQNEPAAPAAPVSATAEQVTAAQAQPTPVASEPSAQPTEVKSDVPSNEDLATSADSPPNSVGATEPASSTAAQPDVTPAQSVADQKQTSMTSAPADNVSPLDQTVVTVPAAISPDQLAPSSPDDSSSQPMIDGVPTQPKVADAQPSEVTEVAPEQVVPSSSNDSSPQPTADAAPTQPPVAAEVQPSAVTNVPAEQPIVIDPLRPAADTQTSENEFGAQRQPDSNKLVQDGQVVLKHDDDVNVNVNANSGPAMPKQNGAQRAASSPNAHNKAAKSNENALSTKPKKGSAEQNSFFYDMCCSLL